MKNYMDLCMVDFSKIKKQYNKNLVEFNFINYFFKFFIFLILNLF